ncbi:hypothetical protein JNK13_10995 [bacterium]|nr:hypothetical protein [bacterium]
MHGLKEWTNEGWIGISLGIKREEIDMLVSLLQALKDEPDQHFHFSSSYQGNAGIGDIEIYLQVDEPDNMSVLGFATAPNKPEA